MSTFVHRNGAHQITVHDEVGRKVALVGQGHTLHVKASGEGPHLTPEMAHELADALHQWATCQQTVRTKIASPAR